MQGFKHVTTVSNPTLLSCFRSAPPSCLHIQFPGSEMRSCSYGPGEQGSWGVPGSTGSPSPQQTLSIKGPLRIADLDALLAVLLPAGRRLDCLHMDCDGLQAPAVQGCSLLARLPALRLRINSPLGDQAGRGMQSLVEQAGSLTALTLLSSDGGGQVPSWLVAKQGLAALHLTAKLHDLPAGPYLSGEVVALPGGGAGYALWRWCVLCFVCPRRTACYSLQAMWARAHPLNPSLPFNCTCRPHRAEPCTKRVGVPA